MVLVELLLTMEAQRLVMVQVGLPDQQQHLQHNLLQLQKEVQVLEMLHQFKQEQEEWHVQHQNQMEL